MRWEFPVLAEGRHIVGLRSKPRAAKDLTAGNIYPPCLTETGKRARKVLGTQGTLLGTDHNFFDEVWGGGWKILKLIVCRG